MLWPEGSTAVVADLGSYLDPQLDNELVRSFVVSKAGSFMAVASRSILALFRLKPLAPLMIHPALFPETEIVEVVASCKGEYLAVRTADNRISVFSVQPRTDIEEVLRMTCIVTPGLGEAIGARELWLDPLHSVHTEYPISALGSWGGLLLVYSDKEVHVVDWHAFDSKDPLKPPMLVPFGLSLASPIKVAVTGGRGRKEWITTVITEDGKASVGIWQGDEAQSVRKLNEAVLPVDKVVCCDYNVRLSKLTVTTGDNSILVFPNLQDLACSFELPNKSSRTPLSLQWNPAGTALLVGYKDGWQLVSMLGLSLYSLRTKASDSEQPLGIVKCEWMVGAETAVMLGTDGRLRLQNMLRWSGFGGSDRGRPVLHGNGRLLLYHDLSARGVAQSAGDGGSAQQSWLTVPLPTWYMAQNWPIAHVCSSSEGKYVVVAGKIGIMLFSVFSKQWKEIGDRESMVRGGICWHGRRLIAASVNPDNDVTSLKMYSPVGGLATSRHDSTSSQNLFGSQFLWPNAPNKHSSSAVHGRHTGTSDQSATEGATSTPRLERRLSAHDLLNGHSHPPGAPLHSSSSANSLQSPLLSSSPSNANISGLSSSEQQVVAEDILGRGPSCLVSMMTIGPQNYLGVLAGGDETSQLLIYDLSRNDFDLIRDIPLASVLADVQPTSVIRAITLIDERQVLVLVGTTLLLVSSVDDEARKYHRRVVADPIEAFEYLHSERQLWVFDGQEAVVTEWKPSEDGTSKRFVASVPLDAYPVHFSSTRGVVSLIESEPVRSFDGRFSVARPSFTHEVYIQHLLEAALSPAYDTAVDIARKYQRAPYFAGVLESLLYRIVCSDDASASDVRLAVNLIREFPSQNAEAIFAGCARKVEMKYWPRLFDAVGAQPDQLFDLCLEKTDLETANEYLIVVQATTNGGDGEDLDLHGRILALYNAAALHDQLWICRQVCEFIMAVDPSGASLKEFRALTQASAASPTGK